jgi:hypothetical protein
MRRVSFTAFQDLYRLPGSRTAKVRAAGPVLDKADRALGYLEQLFPDSIGEACFIDRAGPEIARTVRGERPTPSSPPPSPWAMGRSTRPGRTCRPTPGNG